MFARRLCVAGWAVVLSTSVRADDAVVLHAEKAVLRDGATEIHPQATWSVNESDTVVGDTVISILNNVVTARRGGEVVWKAEEPELAGVRLLGVEHGEIFVAPGHGPGRPDPVSTAHVRRLSLKDGKWLPALTMWAEVGTATAAAMSVQPTAKGCVVAAIADWGLLVEKFECEGEKAPVAIWKHELAFEAKDEDHGPWLLGVPGPVKALPAGVEIVAREHNVFISLGAHGPLICDDEFTGTETWRITNPWEYRRGFVGPSVWSHYVGPFGLDNRFESKGRSIEEARSRFEATWGGTVLGVPAISLDGGHVFLASGTFPRSGWGDYLMEPRVLEVAGGRAESVAPLPACPTGKWRALSNGDVVWACQSETLLCLHPAPPQAEFGFGPGGPDCVTRMSWSRGYGLEPERKSWLAAPQQCRDVAMSDDFAFAAAGDVRVPERDSRIAKLPLACIDMNTGMLRRLTIEVPFEGEAEWPETNYQQYGNCMRLIGPWKVSITRLETSGKTLLVTLGEEERATVLQFDLPGW